VLPSLQTLAFTFPLTPRWTGLATLVYILTWVATFTAAWNLSAYLLGLFFFNPKNPQYQGIRNTIWHASVFDRSLTFWGLILPLGLAASLSQLAIEPGLWSGTFEPLNPAMPTLLALVLLTALTILSSIWAFATPKPSSSFPSELSTTSTVHSSTSPSTSSPLPCVLLSLFTTLLALDKTTGLGISDLDLSTASVNESLMWIFIALSATAAGLAPLISPSSPPSAARLARIALAAGGLAFFFATVTATIRTGKDVSSLMKLAYTAMVLLGACFVLLLTMAHLSKPAKAGGLFRAAGVGACLLMAAIVTVSYLSRSDIAAATISGQGQVAAKERDPLELSPTIAQDYDKRDLDLGKTVFIRNCATCHAIDLRLVGPPVTEIADLYRHDPQKLAAWVKAPGRRRQDYPQMAAIMLTEDRYQAVARFMIALGRTQLEKDAALNEQLNQSSATQPAR
jgi:mono/diheme cytochrome c family protein